MTKLTNGNLVKRETDVHYRRRPLVVEMHSKYLNLHPKGLRTAGVSVSLEAVYELGLKLAAREVAAQKAANRRIK
jgi:hypothetical protein